MAAAGFMSWQLHNQSDASSALQKEHTYTHTHMLCHRLPEQLGQSVHAKGPLRVVLAFVGFGRQGQHE